MAIAGVTWKKKSKSPERASGNFEKTELREKEKRRIEYRLRIKWGKHSNVCTVGAGLGLWNVPLRGSGRNSIMVIISSAPPIIQDLDVGWSQNVHFFCLGVPGFYTSLGDLGHLIMKSLLSLVIINFRG